MLGKLNESSHELQTLLYLKTGTKVENVATANFRWYFKGEQAFNLDRFFYHSILDDFFFK